MMKTLTTLLAVFISVTRATAADPVKAPWLGHTQSPKEVTFPTIKGPVAVIDGRSLWYPQASVMVHLAEIDACELPQWSFSAERSKQAKDNLLRPVPCGPLAKAWLKRAVNGGSILCRGISYDADGTLEAFCSAQGHDLGLEMLRVGWARTSRVSSGPYARAQRIAMGSRYGMWETYVLDMNEWRRKAVDRTLARRPLADMNLLAERESEISPPFIDARHLPKRTDR